MNEPIVFNHLESLHLSARNDKYIYHQLITLRESFNNNANEFKLKKLSLKFFQFRVDTASEILCRLSLIIKDLETIRSLSIEYSPMVLEGEINRLVHTKNIEELHILGKWYSDESTIITLIDQIKPIFAIKSICFEQIDQELDYIKKTSAVILTQAIRKHYNTLLYYRTKRIKPSQDEAEDDDDEDEEEEDFWNGEYVFDETVKYGLSERNIGIEDDDDYDDRETHPEMYD